MSRSSLKNVFRLVEQANKELPVEKSFLEDLKRCIELDNIKDKREPTRSYKPSSLRCIRNMYYQIVGETPDASPVSYSLIGIWNSGSAIHEWLQTAISRMADNGMDCEYIDVGEYVKSRGLKHLEVVGQCGMETKLYHKDLNMRFLCDGILRYKNKYYILEIKSEVSYRWMSREGVEPAHYDQGTAYSLSLDIPDVIFVYVNRDVLDMKSFLFTPTGEMKQDLIGKITECDDYVNRLICPPKPDDIDKRTCSYCEYKQACRADR